MLGIDIGVAAIKLAAMRWRRRRWCLQACVVQPLPDGRADCGEPDPGALQECLTTALARLSVPGRDAAVALSCPDAITRTVSLDADLSDQEMENRMAIAAEQHLPFPLSDANLDFCQLPAGDTAGSSGPFVEQDVLLVACRRKLVEQRVALLEEAGIRAVVVDLDGLALGRLAGAMAPGAAQVILDLGACGFRLHAFAQGRLLYSRNHHVGVLPVTMTESDQVSRLVQEIRRAIQLLLISAACDQDITITLAGGRAALPALATRIAAVCGRPVDRIQLPSEVVPHTRLAAAQWHGSVPQLALACALAMRGR